MNIEPVYVYSSAVSLLVLSLLLSGFLYIINLIFFNSFYFTIFSFVGVFFSFILYLLIINYPILLAERKKILSMQQAIKAILFIVMYMRNNPNLENAIRFAAKYLDYPMNLDFKKIIWDFEVKKFKTFKESLDNYLKRWKDWDYSFVEAFSLIYNSLYEGDPEKRNRILDKALELALASNFERMIKYVHNLKNPLTAVYMLGVILPILGLVILAIAGALMEIHPIYYFLLYNLFLPLIVLYLGYKILLKRPGIGISKDLTKYLPELKEKALYKKVFGLKIHIKVISFIIFFALFSLGLFLMIKNNFLSTRSVESILFSFYGSTLIILGLFFSLYYYLHNKYYLFNKESEKIERMENEFYVILYQLSILLDENLPFEIAIEKIVDLTKNETALNFFSIVEKELILGKGVRDAMKEAIKKLPSSLVLSSLELILEAANKSPTTASVVTKSLSKYLESVKKVINRLLDLLAEIISSIKMQTSFMAPFISAIVVALQAMTISILASLASVINNLNFEDENITMLGFVTSMLEGGTPPSIFQLVVGLYLFEVTYILTFLYIGIQFGFDETKEKYELSKNYLKVGITYGILAFIMTTLLVILGKNIVQTNY
ncbi:MAG TPA: hypothetical protein EYH54_05180 [Nautiliaceae bacterium]|nr:hypothetical protein [Nautiliaceae bacterium]